MLRLLGLLLFSVSSLPANANGGDVPDSVLSTIKERYSDRAIVKSYDHGDLNGDGIEDWATLIEVPDKNRSVNIRKVVVLFGGSDRGFSIFETSNEVIASNDGKNFDKIEIKRNSIYIHTSIATFDEIEHDIDQFKLRDGAFRNIGSKSTESFLTRDEANPNFGLERVVDTNKITGLSIYTTKSHGKVSVEKSKDPGRPQWKLTEWPQ